MCFATEGSVAKIGTFRMLFNIKSKNHCPKQTLEGDIIKKSLC